jgi:hypothetical protein
MSVANTIVEGRNDQTSTNLDASPGDVLESEVLSVSDRTTEQVETEELEILSPSNKHACNFCYVNRRKVYS